MICLQKRTGLCNNRGNSLRKGKMKKTVMAVLVVTLIFSGLPVLLCGARGIVITTALEKATVYEPFIVAAEVPMSVDEGQSSYPIDVYLEVDLSGQTIRVPAFLRSNRERAGSSVWEMRYTPLHAGKYGYRVICESEKQTLKTGIKQFRAYKTGGKGFLRKSPNNPNYLVFDSGEPYFGIGYNVAWTDGGSTNILRRYFRKMAENGCNLSRVWISRWSFPVESGTLGKFSEEGSYRIDKVLETAKEFGIYILLCIDTYGSLMEDAGDWGENTWAVNPYNSKNGGPCAEPRDFFEHPRAREFYKKKLEYIAARWGYSPNILAFELWNEYNAPAEWVKEMAAYLKEADPHGHFVTTSMGHPWGSIFEQDAIWRLPEIDIITEHLYGGKRITDVLGSSIAVSENRSSRFDKPFIISEIGIEGSRDDRYYDQEGRGTALHNYIWATSLSGGLGTAMNWWWDSYIRPYELNRHYKALSRFLEGIDWNAEKVERPRHTQVKGSSAGRSGDRYSDITVRPIDLFGWMKSQEYIIRSNGDLAGAIPAKYIYGKKRREYGEKQTYIVDYPVKGQFIIKINKVSGPGHLVVSVDGQEAISENFPVGPGSGPWERSMCVKNDNTYQCVYNQDVTVQVPAGKHRITIRNKGEDWISIKNITLTNYKDNTYADARCVALQVGEDMMFWIQNRDSNWKTYYTGGTPGSIKDPDFEVLGIKNGTWNIEIWDTRKGDIISTDTVKAEKNKLKVDLPDLTGDVAVKMRR